MVLVSRLLNFPGLTEALPAVSGLGRAAPGERPAGRSPGAGPLLRRLFALLLLLPVFGGCGHGLPRQLPGFDAAAWHADPYACQNRRAAQVPALLRAREQLYDARANAIDGLLGQPDEEELRAQTEKVYYYYLAPGAQCAPGHRRSAAPRLSLRFGPLGTVTEILADPLPPSAPPTAGN